MDMSAKKVHGECGPGELYRNNSHNNLFLQLLFQLSRNHSLHESLPLNSFCDQCKSFVDSFSQSIAIGVTILTWREKPVNRMILRLDPTVRRFISDYLYRNSYSQNMNSIGTKKYHIISKQYCMGCKTTDTHLKRVSLRFYDILIKSYHSNYCSSDQIFSV